MSAKEPSKDLWTPYTRKGIDSGFRAVVNMNFTPENCLLTYFTTILSFVQGCN